MVPAYIAAAVEAQRRSEESAKFARQIPLYREEIAYSPYGEDEPSAADGANREEAALRTPSWSEHY